MIFGNYANLTLNLSKFLHTDGVIKMKKILSFLLIALFIHLPISAQKKSNFPEMKQLQSPQNPKLGFMIHGGAGVIRRVDLTPEKEKAYRAKLEEAVLAGYKALQDGKTSLDAI